MELNRRDFLKLSGASVGGLVITGLPAPSPKGNLTSSTSSGDVEKGVLYDVNKCVGCRACQNACKSWNGLPADAIGFNGIYDNPFNLSDKTFTIIKAKVFDINGINELLFTKFQCMHCKIPACLTACPVGAFTKTAEGPVIYDKGKCIGCRYCMVACPFGVPAYEWEEPMPWVRKCTFCADRQSQGMEPACVAACPDGALKFGKRDDLIAEARERIAAEPERYIDHIYGENEKGGTSWLYLSPVPFEELGFPKLDIEPVTVDVERAMGAIPSVLLGVAATMTGIYWVAQRRQKIKKEES
ncbi:MAG: 4Fe-4S dicluster domain-containing protein [Dehalococcoidales bacterium]|nr:4Fe-4S dicluster domain-containing protein [Dehalococcoidales bacterium]